MARFHVSTDAVTGAVTETPYTPAEEVAADAALAAAALDEQFPPLDPWRFWATVNMPGSIGEANLRAAISGHPDPMFAAVAMARLNNPPGGKFVRGDPMFANADLLGALGINEAVVNTLWNQGHAIPDPAAAG